MLFRVLTAAVAAFTVQPLTPRDGLAQATEAAEASRSGVSQCSVSTPSTIVYVGPTDDALTACLLSADVRVRTVILSSPGGDAGSAMMAADVIRARGFGVQVRGVCASSCANYLVPAATRITVEPYSAILLHGAPDQAMVDGFRREGLQQLREAAPGLSDEALASAMDANVGALQQVVRGHADFSRAYRVDQRWYDLQDFDHATLSTDLNWFAVADPAFIRSSLPKTKHLHVWFPRDEAARSALQGVVGLSRLAYRRQS